MAMIPNYRQSEGGSSEMSTHYHSVLGSNPMRTLTPLALLALLVIPASVASVTTVETQHVMEWPAGPAEASCSSWTTTATQRPIDVIASPTWPPVGCFMSGSGE